MSKKQKIKKKKKVMICLFSLCPLLAFVGVGGIFSYMERPVLQQLNYTDSGEQLSNPERGWYLINGYVVKKDGETGEGRTEALEEMTRRCEELKADGDRLFEYQIQMKELVEDNLDIPQSSLDTISEQLGIMRAYGIQAVVRPIYDWDGKEKPEPEFTTIRRHIRQLGAVFTENQDVILCIEAGLLGPFGEWHSTKYDGNNYRRAVIREYLKNTPATMQISVRCPRFYRAIFNTDKPVTEAEAYTGADSARVGFHNDGYLGSESDLGTYTDWSREQELQFQESHNRYLVFGGEATLVTEYGELFAAISDMKRTHCTYLNREHYLPLKEEWKNTIYEGKEAVEPAWIGKTGYEYIRAHLGYRYVLKESMLSEKVRSGKTIRGRLKIENVGFGNMVKEKKSWLVLTQGEKELRLELDLEVRTLHSGETTEYYFVCGLPQELEKGEWDAGLLITGASGAAVSFANPGTFNEESGTNKIGSVTVIY